MSRYVTLPSPPIIRDVRGFMRELTTLHDTEIRNDAFSNVIRNRCFRVELDGALFDDPRREPQHMYVLTHDDWISSAQCQHILSRMLDTWNGRMSLFHVDLRGRRFPVRADVMDDAGYDTQFICIRVFGASQ